MRSKILDERRKGVRPRIRQQVALSLRIVDRIHDILEEKGLRQKDLAIRLGKSEAEISKWMRGTHNFTIDTVSSIESALDAPILEVYKPRNRPVCEYETMAATEAIV